jgi:hypothetical protein
MKIQLLRTVEDAEHIRRTIGSGGLIIVRNIDITSILTGGSHPQGQSFPLRVDRTEKNRQDTIHAAEELLHRANDFIKEFLSVGDAFKDVFEKYEAAKGRIVDGPGGQSIAKSVAKLVRLGVQPRTRGKKTYELAAPIVEAEC